MRPMWPQLADSEANAEAEDEEEVEGCDVEGRAGGLPGPGEEVCDGWLPSLELTPLASRGVRGRAGAGGAGRGGATEGKAEGECEE